MQDFAGSTAVHLIGATGALAALLLLGAAEGQVRHRRQAAGDPGPQHAAVRPRRADPVARLVRVQPGLDLLNALDGRFAEILMITNIAAAVGVLAAVPTARLKTGTIDIGMAGNGAIAGLVAITAPSGYVELWAAPIIGAVAGVIVVLGVYAIDKYHRRPGRRPLGPRPGRDLGNASRAGIFTAPRLAQYNAFGDPEGGLVVQRARSQQLIAQAVGFADRVLVRVRDQLRHLLGDQEDDGLRVTEDEEDAGLDISEHGMYGYPEQFIPPAEYPGGRHRARPSPTPARDRRHDRDDRRPAGQRPS